MAAIDLQHSGHPAARTVRVLWASLLPVALIVGYELWSNARQDPFFPNLERMTSSFVSTWGGDALRVHIIPSLTNLLVGYAIGLVTGVLIGIWLGRSHFARRATAPLIGFILTIPAVAVLPLFLIILGIGQQLQIGIIVFATIFIVIVTTTNAVQGIDQVLLDASDIYRIRNWRRIAFVLFPAVLPQILSAARVTLSLSVLVMVVSEMIGSSDGIGATILLAQQSFDYGALWAGMLLIAILGIALNLAFSFGERRLLIGIGMEVPEKRKVK